MPARIILFIKVLLLCQIVRANPVEVQKGEITVDAQTLQQSELIRLKGAWMFATGTLEEGLQQVRNYISFQNIPDTWSNYRVDGATVPLHGRNYYKLVIQNPEKLDDLGLLIYGPVVDYRIYANGRPIFMTKRFLPPDIRESRPERTRDVLPLPATAVIELEIEVINTIHYQSGMTVVPMLGKRASLARSEELRSYFEMILIGCLLFMVVYHGVLYFQIRKPSYLLLGLSCLVVMVRALIVFDGSLLLFQLVPALSFALSKKIEFFMVYATIFLAPLFIEYLFSQFKYKKISLFFVISGIAMMLMVLFTPPRIFAGALNVYHFLYMMSNLYMFYLLYDAIKRKKRGAWTVAIGMLVSFVFIFLEIIRNSDLVDFYHAGPNLVNTGVVVFLFFQTVVISSVFANYRAETVRKSMELKNSQLEKEAIEQELKFREKELADYTFTMIQRNRFLDEIEDIVQSANKNSKAESGATLKTLLRSIQLNRQSRNEWEDFNKHFGNVHSDFFKRLRDGYPQLSSNDLRHCALIKMNLSLKESADILGVDHNSIKTARYRMRKKMKLEEAQKLKDIIAAI